MRAENALDDAASKYPPGPRLGPSGKRAAKKAAKQALERGGSTGSGGGGKEAYGEEGLPRAGAVADAMAAMICSGAAYMGFQAGPYTPPLVG
jgi:hypothetical protein